MPPDPSNDIKIMASPLAGESPTVLMGFPGSGLVGSIALQFMVDQLEFPLIGNMTSKYFAPFVMMAKGLSVTPLSTFYRKYAPVPPILGQFSDECSSARGRRMEEPRSMRPFTCLNLVGAPTTPFRHGSVGW